MMATIVSRHSTGQRRYQPKPEPRSSEHYARRLVRRSLSRSFGTLAILVIFGGLLLFTRDRDPVADLGWDDNYWSQVDSFDDDLPAVLPDDITTVQGIRVHIEIADDIDHLLTAARADGLELDGYGYRTNDQQIELRKRHCGTTDFDIFEKRASECSPPTARPGSSRHERGRAIDFRYNGRTIKSRDSEAFVWLAENAIQFGLENLPSEPWHWSVDGR